MLKKKKWNDYEFYENRKNYNFRIEVKYVVCFYFIYVIFECIIV